MKEEYVQYGKRLETIGDLIIETSQLINDKEDFTSTKNKFEYAIQSLEEVKTPVIIIDEHKGLVKALNEWLKITTVLNKVNNEEEFNNTVNLQKEKESTILSITQSIGDKLIANINK